MRVRKWTKEQLEGAVKKSSSIRKVLILLGLKPAGGNYSQINKYIRVFQIKTDHFKGRGWSKGLSLNVGPRIPIEKILVEKSNFQSYKLKKRLLQAGLKKAMCEECGWSKRASDGRQPLEVHHVNGDPRDNRIGNLKILCPNCHSLKPNYRGKNKKTG